MSNILQMNLCAGILIFCIMVLRKVAVGRLPRRLFVLLWGVAIVRLFVPYSLTIPSIGATQSAQAVIPSLQSAIVLRAREIQTGQPLEIIPVLWLGGAVLMTLFFTALLIRSHRSLRDALPIESSPVTDEWADKLKFRRIRILTSDRIGTPIAYGVFHPKIVLPKTMDLSDSKKLGYVLNHELVHIKRFDTVLKFCSIAVLCIHWFNPLVWVMYRVLNRDIELACDEKVISIVGEGEKSSYLFTLLSLAEQSSKSLPLCSAFGKTAIEERIVIMIKSKKFSRIAIALSVVIIAASMIIFTKSTIVNAESTSEKQATEEASEFMMMYGANAVSENVDGESESVDCILDSEVQADIYRGSDTADGHTLIMRYFDEQDNETRVETTIECDNADCDIEKQHSDEILQFASEYLEDLGYEISVAFGVAE